MKVVALDFETANHGPESACALGLARIEEGAIVDQAGFLICPPDADFRFTHVHGLRWEDVCDAPAFAEVIPAIDAFCRGADFLAAHNATFDRGVWRACYGQAGRRPPQIKFVCTLKIARKAWRLESYSLSSVCRHLGIPLRHHDALSDTLACARIILLAGDRGVGIHDGIIH